MVNLCRDEVTATLKQRIEQIFGSSFSTNGLGGVLTCGKTGMGAGFSHSPLCSSNKERYVFFSFPHISINSRGEVGPLARPGRPEPSCACGALIKAHNEIRTQGLMCNCKIPGGEPASARLPRRSGAAACQKPPCWPAHGRLPGCPGLPAPAKHRKQAPIIAALRAPNPLRFYPSLSHFPHATHPPPPTCPVHEPLEPEYSILKQRIARRLRHEGATDESVKGLSLAELTRVAERTISDDLEHLIAQSVDPAKADYAGDCPAGDVCGGGGERH
jgi:hypothetical protein